MPVAGRSPARAHASRSKRQRGRPVRAATPEQRRARLVQAAITAIARDGLAATSTRSVAAAAGVDPAMLHYAFDSKHALLQAVMAAIHDEIRSLLSASISDARTLPDAVAQMARGYWAHVLATPQLQRAQYELTLHALATPGNADLARLQYEGYRDTLAAALAQRLMRPTNAALTTFAGLCVATMDGLILQHLACNDHAAGQARLELAIDLLRRQARSLA
ncbi:MAG: TetR family transcriptional regulator [Nevskiaceae bacterium]|nr:MAG: TetR family transcriptional regulator [Nevskiaceae bacterium]